MPIRSTDQEAFIKEFVQILIDMDKFDPNLSLVSKERKYAEQYASGCFSDGLSVNQAIHEYLYLLD